MRCPAWKQAEGAGRAQALTDRRLPFAIAERGRPGGLALCNLCAPHFRKTYLATIKYCRMTVAAPPHGLAPSRLGWAGLRTKCGFAAAAPRVCFSETEGGTNGCLVISIFSDRAFNFSNQRPFA